MLCQEGPNDKPALSVLPAKILAHPSTLRTARRLVGGPTHQQQSCYKESTNIKFFSFFLLAGVFEQPLSSILIRIGVDFEGTSGLR